MGGGRGEGVVLILSTISISMQVNLMMKVYLCVLGVACEISNPDFPGSAASVAAIFSVMFATCGESTTNDMSFAVLLMNVIGMQ